MYGFFISKIHGSILTMIINDVLAEVLLIISTLYFTFSTAALMGLSGPVAILTYNIFFEHSTVSKEGELAVKKFCESAAFFAGVYLAGTAGFVWIEELCDEIEFINNKETILYTMNYLIKDLIWIFILYVLVVSCRMIILVMLSFALRNDAIAWKEAVLMSWGEIPGPINIIMALIALLDPNLSWIPGCQQARFNPTNPFQLHSPDPSSRVIGTCDGDVVVNDLKYMLMDDPIPSSTLSEIYGIAQQKVFFYGIGVLIIGEDRHLEMHVFTRPFLYRIRNIETYRKRNSSNNYAPIENSS